MYTLVIKRMDTGNVLSYGQADDSDPLGKDAVLRAVLGEARLTSRVREYEVAVTRWGQTAEIARYCDGKRV